MRFVSQHVDTGRLTAAPVPTEANPHATGPSPYGVWGALGSISGGEVIGDF